MVPAMDRSKNSLARWSGVGLVLALGCAGPGCARLKPQRRVADPPMIGEQQASRDVYANAHRAKAAPAALEPPPPNSGTASTSPAEVAEVGMAVQPATDEAPGVALMPPVSAESARMPDATAGVPNASLLLASAEHRAASPADPARLVAEARAALDRMANYQVSLHRQERVNGTLQPEEDVILAVRREPRAVRLTWADGPHKGREVLYRADEPGGLMHVNMADSALPIPRLSIAPDSPMVMRNSRHPITEAGFESLIRRMEESLKSSGPSGISYAGLQTPAPLVRPHHCLVRTDPSGEVSRVYMDPRTHLPALYAADSADGELLERYVFQDVRADLPELTIAEAFDPDARWGPPRGLFGRVARRNGEPPADAAGRPPR